MEGQREVAERFGKAQGISFVNTITKVETGKGSGTLETRPQLAERQQATIS